MEGFGSGGVARCRVLVASADSATLALLKCVCVRVLRSDKYSKISDIDI